MRVGDERGSRPKAARHHRACAVDERVRRRSRSESASTRRGRSRLERLGSATWLVVGCVLAAAACNGVGTLASVGGSASSGGGVASGATGGASGGTSFPDEPPDAMAIEAPFVACTLGDGGADADAESADIADGGAGADEAGTRDSPCSTPPPSDCVSQTAMVVFRSEGCDGERCVFVPMIMECPGGCFRQVDGGDRCNP